MFIVDILFYGLFFALLLLILFEIFSRIDIFILKRRYESQKARLEVIFDTLVDLRVGLLTGDYPEFVDDIVDAIADDIANDIANEIIEDSSQEDEEIKQ